MIWEVSDGGIPECVVEWLRKLEFRAFWDKENKMGTLDYEINGAYVEDEFEWLLDRVPTLGEAILAVASKEEKNCTQ